MTAFVDYEQALPFLESYRRRLDLPTAMRAVTARQVFRQARRAGLDDLSGAPEDLPLAVFELPTGGAVKFVGRRFTGDLFIEMDAQNSDMADQVYAVMQSPVKVFTTLAGPAVPIPWLIAAADRTDSIDTLLRDRQITNRLPPQQVQSLNPVPDRPAADHLPAAGDITWSGYCGHRGEENFYHEFCRPEWDPALWITRCSHILAPEIVHTIDKHRRARTITLSVGCLNGYVVSYQWRKLGLFKGWHWHTEMTTIHQKPGFYFGMHFGFARRRRRVRYTSIPGLTSGGGVRAETRFS